MFLHNFKNTKNYECQFQILQQIPISEYNLSVLLKSSVRILKSIAVSKIGRASIYVV